MTAAADLWNFNFVKTNGGSALGTDTIPTSQEPATDGSVAAPWRTPHDVNQGRGQGGGGVQYGIISVGGACTVRCWVKDSALGWIPVKSAVAITNTDFTVVTFPAGALAWIEVTANAGSATKLLAGIL